MFVPGLLSDFYDSFRYLRYRSQHRGRWMIDILRGDLTHGGLAFANDKIIGTLPSPNRRAARSRVEELARLLTAHGLDALPNGDETQQHRTLPVEPPPGDASPGDGRGNRRYRTVSGLVSQRFAVQIGAFRW
jgi:hypothetical protein